MRDATLPRDRLARGFVMIERGIPTHGDVVIDLDTRGAGRLYVLRVLPEGPQIGYTTRTTAVTKGRAFAARLGVNVWYAGRSGYELLGRFRHPSPTPVAP